MELPEFPPHPFPTPLLDRVVDINPGRRLTGIMTVQSDSPRYQDGLPSYVVLEAWLQAATALVAWHRPRPSRPVRPGRLKDVALIRQAYASEVVLLDVRVIRAGTSLVILTGQATVDGVSILTVGQATAWAN